MPILLIFIIMKKAPLQAVLALTAALSPACESDCMLHYPPDSTVAENVDEAVKICEEGRANFIACVIDKDEGDIEYFDCDSNLSALEDNLNEADCDDLIGVENEGDVTCLSVQGGG